MGKLNLRNVQICFIICLAAIYYCQGENVRKASFNGVENVQEIRRGKARQAENPRGPKRTRVSPYAGMIPFFRTGRSRSSFTELENSEEPYKRAKSGRTIMAFPRVGRSNKPDLLNEEVLERKTSSNTNGNGLWFGPRLGRINKRQDYKKDVPMAYLYFGDYTPRLGRESEEFLEDIDALPEDKENEKSILESM